MESLKQSTTDYLLDSGLEAMHQQSMEWLEDIAFWRDEAAFLYALEVKKTLVSVPVDAKNKIQKIENELVKISGGGIDELYNEVEGHEEMLDRILENQVSISEEEYRSKHKQIATKIELFNERFKALKKKIFDLVRNNRPSLIKGIPG